MQIIVSCAVSRMYVAVIMYNYTARLLVPSVDLDPGYPVSILFFVVFFSPSRQVA